jgi:cellulose synthase/poly-beta-1,6-N-acetylglucosamine synthase-like glycosyltransferase
MAALGNVSCLSGTVIYVRLDALLAVMWPKYKQDAKLNEYWKENFGDDRSLTQRLTERFGPGATTIQSNVVSETQAAVPLTALIEQRRRWLLGTIATEVGALCSPTNWTDSFWQCVYRLWLSVGAASDIRALLMLCMAVHMPNGGAKTFTIFAVSSSLISNAVTLLSFPAVRLRLSFPMYCCTLLLLPIVNVTTRLRTLMSLRNRSWGGVRAI